MTASNKTEEDVQLTRLSTIVFLLGASLGLLAERLLWAGGPTGLGFVLWVALFGLAACALVARTGVSWLREALGWSGLALIAACMLLFRTAPVVILAMWSIMLVAAAMVFMRRSSKTLRNSTIADQLISACKVPLHAALSIITVVSRIEIRSTLLNPRLRSICRGALLATPILLVFALLFASADAVFNRYALLIMDVFSPEALRHLLMIAVFGWWATGLLAGVCENRFFLNRREWNPIKLGTEDTAVFMGLLVALFLVFVFLQLGYLFGGPETIQATTGLTLAEYARRGFFELLGVTALTLILLITISNSSCNQRVFRPLAAILVICVLIILASAAQRLGMYITEFGMTIDRITASTVMLWLALGLILFVLTILRGRVKDFAAGLTVSGIIVAFLLALANPAAVVVNVNIDRAINNNRPVDMIYLLSLGSDAVPALANRIDSLPDNVRCEAIALAILDWYPGEVKDQIPFSGWRAWNASRAAAENAVQAEGPGLLESNRVCRR